jgi:heme exporter protein C
MVAYYAPVDQDGLNQKIFYFHVPIALTAYACFGWGALKAFLYLWKGGEARDLESYVAVHLGVVFALMALVTGSIWAKIAWGHWWEWGDRQLVMFLILFLFYCAYFMLRFSIEPGPQRASISSVYAIFGVVLIPISFLAIRLAESLVHPVAFTRDGPQMAGSQFLTFVVCLAAMLALVAALYRIELAGKRLDARLRELKELLA